MQDRIGLYGRSIASSASTNASFAHGFCQLSPSPVHSNLPPLPAQVVHPVVHQRTAALEQITARVGRLDLIAYDVSECSFDHLAGMVRPFRGPIPEARSEAL